MHAPLPVSRMFDKLSGARFCSALTEVFTLSILLTVICHLISDKYDGIIIVTGMKSKVELAVILLKYVINGIVNKKAVLSQGNRAMLQLFFSV